VQFAFYQTSNIFLWPFNCSYPHSTSNFPHTQITNFSYQSADNTPLQQHDKIAARTPSNFLSTIFLVSANTCKSFQTWCLSNITR
jgi:hypothetical protein